jgi:predicted acetyltransferase
MELRPATRAEMEEYSRAALRAFHRELSDHDRTRYARIDEPERSLAWFDDGRIVATTGAFTRRITVPGGGAVPCAAVTAVAVVPTHRRRGLLTAMMRRQLDDLRERGDPLAALWASEGRIYGRFGYGIAARAATLVARRPEARVAPAPSSDGAPLRAGPAGDQVDAMRAVYEHVRPQRPGLLDRPGPWWGDRLDDPEEERRGAQPLQAAVVEDGYAIYAVRPDEEAETGPEGEVVVREVVAATPAAHSRLWAFLLDQDLTRTIKWELAPADEPLWLALTDPTAVRMSVHDGLWLRLVDVGAALAERAYASDADVVFDVADGFCEWNAGRYRLTGERTDAAADVAVDVAALASAYLGGVTFHELAAAGRARELTPGAVARAAAAFRGDVEPWCADTF